MLSTPEPEPRVIVPPKSFREILATVFGNSDLRRVILFDLMFSIATVSLNFSSVYLVQTLGFSYTYITAVAVGHAVFRAVVSPYLGRLADRKSWAYMLRICMVVLMVGYIIYMLCLPANAFYLYPVFSLCYAFSLGGSNAARTNLCLDYVKHEDRRYVLGIKDAIHGVGAFLATLVASVLVSNVEKNGNQMFGMTVYPQQILYAISAVMLFWLAFFFLPKLKKPSRIQETKAQDE